MANAIQGQMEVEVFCSSMNGTSWGNGVWQAHDLYNIMLQHWELPRLKSSTWGAELADAACSVPGALPNPDAGLCPIWPASSQVT